MRLLKIIAALATLVAVQSHSARAQNAVGFADVQKLYDEKKYTAVLSAVDPLIARYGAKENAADFPEVLANLYFMRGSSRYNAIYQARTGVVFGTDGVFDENRPRFEVNYNENFIKLLDGAIVDLNKALATGTAQLLTSKSDSGFDYRFKSLESEIRKIEALTYLEKAQVVTNRGADFLLVRAAFERLDEFYYRAYPEFDLTGQKKGEVLAAEIRSRIALGQIDEAFLVYDRWMKANGLLLKKEIAVAAMIEAFDLVGNYKYAEALLLRESVKQITIDKGKVVPANFTRMKAAMKSHLYNLNFAVQILPTGRLLPFQRARLASAYNIKGNLTPAESAFIKNAPDVIRAEKETPPIDIQLLAVTLKLQSTDKAEADSARKTLEEMLKKDAANAAILATRGYSKLLIGDFKGAETDLSAAIKKDPFLSFSNGAFQNRALVYTKMGKADLAAKDEKDSLQFKQLLNLLASS